MRCSLLRNYFIPIQSVCSSFSRLKYALAITIHSKQYKVSSLAEELNYKKNYTCIYDNNKNSYLSTIKKTRASSASRSLKATYRVCK